MYFNTSTVLTYHIAIIGCKYLHDISVKNITLTHRCFYLHNCFYSIGVSITVLFQANTYDDITVFQKHIRHV